MRRLFVAVSKFVLNLLYRIRCTRGPRERTIVFLSRQANVPSYDFSSLAREFERRGWRVVIHVKKLTKRTALSYVGHVLREVGLLARCRVAVVDRYDPIISLLDFTCESPDAFAGILHHEFPTEPVVVQLWHAFGAFKKFGYQSIGTKEGHTREVADTFNVHRNYSWVVCSGEGCRSAFAEAFACPVERVVALKRPEFDELIALRETMGRSEASLRPTKILMAPTLRKSKGSAHPFRDLYEHAAAFEEQLDAEVVWSFHPLEEGLPAPGNVSTQLKECDIVVTDYSSIVYEAYLLGKPLLFYTPDIVTYRESPGLNRDPSEICAQIVSTFEDGLLARLRALIEHPEVYDHRHLAAFCADAFDKNADLRPATAQLADFICAQTTNASG